MTISRVSALPIGNALLIEMEPPKAAEFWRLLRRTDTAFAGPEDAEALVVHDGNDAAVIDDRAVINGVTYHYAAYYWMGSAWEASATHSGVAAATYRDESADAQTIVRDRLEAGLTVEVQRGVLEHQAGGIPVLTAPPSTEDTRWPVVTVHVRDAGDATRALGDLITPDVRDPITGEYIEGTGWLEDVKLEIIGWCLNANERQTLRQAIRRVIVGNIPVFGQHGMVECHLSQQDTEDFTSYGSPVYMVSCTFSCQAPVLVANGAPHITDVDVIYKEG